MNIPPWEDEPPTIQQELDRKTVEALEHVMFGLTKRNITVSQAHYYLQALWSQVSGLIPGETMNLLATSATAVEQRLKALNPPDQTTVLTSGAIVVVVTRTKNEVMFRYHKDGGTAAPVVVQHESCQLAAEKFDEVQSKLLAQNYTQLL